MQSDKAWDNILRLHEKSVGNAALPMFSYNSVTIHHASLSTCLIVEQMLLPLIELIHKGTLRYSAKNDVRNTAVQAIT